MNTDTWFGELLLLGLYALIGLVAGVAISVLLSALMRAFKHGKRTRSFLSKRLRTPQRLFFVVAGIGSGLAIGTSSLVQGSDLDWRPAFMHAFLVVMIFVSANVVVGLLQTVSDVVIAQHNALDDQIAAARVRTQMEMMTRVGTVLIWIIAVAGALLTFDAFRAIGASIFASAGLLSIVAGIAAQSSLANLFAGMHIAFTGSIRVGDIISYGDYWTRVEEITLTYVVLKSWDERRIVVPSTRFINDPFENWTRDGTQITGSVFFDLDWLVPVEAFRAEVKRVVEASPDWDGRDVQTLVTDATDGDVQLRVQVTAANASQLWDLRCEIREKLIDWLQTQAPYALPRTRLEPDTTTAPPKKKRDELVDETHQALEKQLAERKNDAPAPEPQEPPPAKPENRLTAWITGKLDR